MEFTYSAYKSLISLLKDSGYAFTDYKEYKHYNKCVILRHDIDNSIDRALEIAKIEAAKGVKSTYFVLLATRFYNVAEKEYRNKVLEIKRLGHDIGLHFDELNYPKDVEVEEQILLEADLLGKILQTKIESVSMHRPSAKTLNANYTLKGKLINSYGEEFFKGFKYISDSRRRWREDPIETIRSDRYPRLHILTHPFWYHREEMPIEETVKQFVMAAREERYQALSENITGLESIMPKVGD